MAGFEGMETMETMEKMNLRLLSPSSFSTWELLICREGDTAPSLNLTWLWRLVSHGSHTGSVKRYADRRLGSVVQQLQRLHRRVFPRPPAANRP